MTPAILSCTLGHARVSPVKHAFSYPLTRYLLDVDELSILDRDIPHFGYNRFALMSIYDRDFLDRGPGTIREKVECLLEKNGIDGRADRILMITDASLLRYVFNPVSFYYVFASDGSLTAVLLEVNNVVGDRHLYIVPGGADAGGTRFPVSHRLDKDFHVSPFNNREGAYEMRFSDARERFEAHIDLHRDGELVFKAGLTERERVPLTRGNLLRAAFRPLLAPWRTMPRILLHAARLYFGKKLPFHPRPAVSSPRALRIGTPGPFRRFCRRRIESALSRIREGRLDFETPEGAKTFGDPEAAFRALVTVRDWAFFPRIALGGDIGFGEAYMDGLWDTPDLNAVIRVLIENRRRLEDRRLAPTLVNAALNRAGHLLRDNTLRGSRRNIQAHYDLSNAFFRTFLDPSMSYSSGIYRDPSEGLDEAQANKLDAVIEKARIRPGDHVLEIGCGWGSFAIRAAQTRGCRVTGLTLSEEQFVLARERVRAEGLEDRIEILLMDYRKISGPFDKIVSIEMLEAVGHRHLETFFRRCDELLVKDGLAVIQVITIPDQRYDAYRKSTDWIRKHIFPGGHLPSLTAMCDAMTRASSFIVESAENIGVHYARTLSDWKIRFLKHPENREAMEKRSVFHRKWLYYFCYCQAAFESRTLENLQLVLTRPGNSILPPAPYHEFEGS